MYEQIFYYNLTIFQNDNLTIALNALLLLIIFLISLKLKKAVFKKVIYLIIVVGVTNLFVFTTHNQALFDVTIFSKLSYFIYNLLNYPINSLNTYFMIYSYLNILVFVPFYLIFRKHRYFIGFIVGYSLLQILFVSLQLASIDFSVYHLVLNIVGYLIGYLINYFKGGNIVDEQE